MQEENIEALPIFYDNNKKQIKEGFYFYSDGLCYISTDGGLSWWTIQRDNDLKEEYLQKDYAETLKRVENSSELIKKLRSELKFMKRKASEFFSQ